MCSCAHVVPPVVTLTSGHNDTVHAVQRAHSTIDGATGSKPPVPRGYRLAAQAHTSSLRVPGAHRHMDAKARCPKRSCAARVLSCECAYRYVMRSCQTVAAAPHLGLKATVYVRGPVGRGRRLYKVCTAGNKTAKGRREIGLNPRGVCTAGRKAGTDNPHMVRSSVQRGCTCRCGNERSHIATCRRCSG